MASKSASAGGSTSTSAAARNEFFKQLKPCCVSISQLAIRPPESPAQSAQLAALLRQLLDLLSAQVQRDASALDDRLAGYVFFPLSHVFRHQDRHPPALLEPALRCLVILVVHGWGKRGTGDEGLSAQLVQQLLVLLTFILGGVPGKEDDRELPEETALEGFRALTALISTAGASGVGSAALVEAGTIPALGHCVSVVLDGVVDGATPDVQVEALRALRAVFAAVKDHAAVATFLPGTVSALTKVLSAPVAQKRRVLVSAIQTLQAVLTRVLGDIRTRSIITPPREGGGGVAAKRSDGEDDKDKGKVLTPAWLSATAAQIKLALATVLKLRSHEAEDVRQALERLAVALLDECHASLANCTQILVETAMILTPESTETSLTDTSFQHLAVIYPELGESVKAIVYNWITSLPRLMESSDEAVKQQAIRNLHKGMETLASLQIDSTTLEESIASALRDGVSALAVSTKTARVTDESALWSTKDLINSEGANLPGYAPVLLGQESEAATRRAMLDLVSNIGSAAQQTSLAREMLDYARESSGSTGVSAYWLSFELSKAALSSSGELDSFLDFSATVTSPGEDHEEAFQDLYDFSVTTLDSHSELSEADWRTEAIALEVVAFAAARSGADFRPELIDILFPVAAFLGSGNPQLRNHAIVTLNSLASSCGYGSVSELVVDNADYMVNSVSLRLNTFDVSPTLTKVLAMLVRLTGPGLVPFLDDVVASIFAALDNYHGYPVFVEGLFGVLREVVEQGVKSDRLMIEGARSGDVDHKKQRPRETTFADVMETLNRREKTRLREDTESEGDVEKGHPKRPWASSKGKGKEGQDSQPSEDDAEGAAAQAPEESKLAKTPTYTLLEKVAYLTQHHLTSPIPTLRKSLLDLLATASPALAADQDAYLPLVNAVWPVVVDRLRDREGFVVVAACDALAGICKAAGDFLASRVRGEWRPSLGRWFRTAKTEATAVAGGRSNAASSIRGGRKGAPAGALHRPARIGGAVGSGARGRDILMPVSSGSGLEAIRSDDLLVRADGGASASARAVSASAYGSTGGGGGGGGGLGRFAQAAQTWDAAVRLLVAIVTYVRVDDAVFDEILELLAEEALGGSGGGGRNEAALAALEAVNADAVWLARYQRGQIEWQPAPVVGGEPLPPMQRFG